MKPRFDQDYDSNLINSAVQRSNGITNTTDAPSISITFQKQYQYRLGIDIQQKTKLYEGFGKCIYTAEWMSRPEQPIILLEIKGDKASREALLYLTLGEHPHIIQTFGMVEPNQQSFNSDSVVLLQEYARDGDLAELLATKKFIPSQAVLIEIFIQIADAMIYLAKQQVVHGDLACRNVLVFRTDPYEPKRNEVKLMDFGLTRVNADCVVDDVLRSRPSKTIVPIRYAAPEILRSEGQSNYSEKSDVYSMGTLMWEACSRGKIPFKPISRDEDVQRLKLEGSRLERPAECRDQLWRIITQCWHETPELRPTFEELKRQLSDIQMPELHIATTNKVLPSLSDEYIPRLPIDTRHIEYCTQSPKITRRTPLSQESIIGETQLPCEFCGELQSSAMLEIHQRTCENNLRASRSSIAVKRPSAGEPGIGSRYPLNEKSQSSWNISTADRSFSSIEYSPRNEQRSISTRNAQSSSMYAMQPASSFQKTTARLKPITPDVARIPCEICKKSIDNQQYNTHLKQCIERDRQRIENRKKQVERQPNLEKYECEYCHRLFQVSELDGHENVCAQNPRNNAQKNPTGTKTTPPKTQPMTKQTLLQRICGWARKK